MTVCADERSREKERRHSDLGIKEPRARGGENTSGGIGQGGAYTISVAIKMCHLS